MGYLRSAVACALSVLLAAVTVAVISSAGSPVAAAETCDNAPLAGKPTLKVLVIGDSLSQGYAGDYTWRYRFWKAQRAKGVNIDFVGPFPNLMGVWNNSAANQRYADPCFTEREHFAVGGKAMQSTMATGSLTCPDGSTAMGTEVARVTQCYQPDVVVGFMGYNDLKSVDDKGLGRTADQLITTASQLISQVRQAKEGTPVALATVLSTAGSQVHVDGSEYNAKLAAKVPVWSSDAGAVSLIDASRDWVPASAGDGPISTWDGYHPNANGEMHLAWGVADGLHALGLLPALDRPIPVLPIGPQTPGTLSASKPTATSLRIGWDFPEGADRQVLQRRDLTAGTDWAVVSNLLYSSSYTMQNLASHHYQFRARAAKGTAYAEVAPGVPRYSPVLDVDLSSPGMTPTATPTPTTTPTATATPTDEPTEEPTPTPTEEPTPTPTEEPTPTPTPTLTPTPTPTPTAPASPSKVPELTTAAGYHAVALSWGSVAGTSRYSVAWRKSGSAAAWQGIATSGRTAKVTGLVAGQPYVFRIRAAAPQEGPATQIVVTPTGVVPPAPSRPALTKLSGQRVKLVWGAARGATRYQVQVRVGNGAWRHLGWTTATRAVTKPLAKGRTYAFRIRPYHQLVAGKVSAGSRIAG